MCVEMGTRTEKTRYECVVYPMYLYYGLNDSTCFTEWIGVRMLQVSI